MMGMSKNKTRTKDKYRVVYNDTQRIELENEFRLNEYIAIPRKQEIASKLQLSERQIKIWFQNRRAKKRKQLKRKQSNGNEVVVRPAASHSAASIVTSELDHQQQQHHQHHHHHHQQHHQQQQQQHQQQQQATIGQQQQQATYTNDYVGQPAISPPIRHLPHLHNHHQHSNSQLNQQHQQCVQLVSGQPTPTLDQHLYIHPQHPQQQPTAAQHHQHHALIQSRTAELAEIYESATSLPEPHVPPAYTNGYETQTALSPHTSSRHHPHLHHHHHSNNHLNQQYQLQHQQPVQLVNSQMATTLGQHHYIHSHHPQQQPTTTQHHQHHALIQSRSSDLVEVYETATSAPDPHVPSATTYSHQFQQAHNRVNSMSIDQHSAMISAVGGVEAT